MAGSTALRILTLISGMPAYAISGPSKKLIKRLLCGTELPFGKRRLRVETKTVVCDRLPPLNQRASVSGLGIEFCATEERQLGVETAFSRLSAPSELGEPRSGMSQGAVQELLRKSN